MKIATQWNGRTRYYVATSNGKAIIGHRGAAAELPPPIAAQVLAHLKQIDHRFTEAELIP